MHVCQAQSLFSSHSKIWQRWECWFCASSCIWDTKKLWANCFPESLKNKRKRFGFMNLSYSLYLNNPIRLQYSLQDQKMQDKILQCQEKSNCSPTACSGKDRYGHPRLFSLAVCPKCLGRQSAYRCLNHPPNLLCKNSLIAAAWQPLHQASVVSSHQGHHNGHKSPEVCLDPSLVSDYPQCCHKTAHEGILCPRSAPQGTCSPTQGQQTPYTSGSLAFPISSLVELFSMLWKDIFCFNG